MNAEIILKRDEKDYLLQMTADDSPARPILAEASGGRQLNRH
jgi:hypothetical protein